MSFQQQTTFSTNTLRQSSSGNPSAPPMYPHPPSTPPPAYVQPMMVQQQQQQQQRAFAAPQQQMAYPQQQMVFQQQMGFQQQQMAYPQQQMVMMQPQRQYMVPQQQMVMVQPQQQQQVTSVQQQSIITNIQIPQNTNTNDPVFRNNRASGSFNGRADLDSKLNTIMSTSDSLYSSVLTDKDRFQNGGKSPVMKNLKKSLTEINITLDKIITDINLTHKKAMTDVEFQTLLVKSFNSVSKLMELIRNTKRRFSGYLGSKTTKKLCMEIESKSSQVSTNLKMAIQIDGTAAVGGQTGIQLNLDDREDITKISQLSGNAYVNSTDLNERL